MYYGNSFPFLGKILVSLVSKDSQRGFKGDKSVPAMLCSSQLQGKADSKIAEYFKENFYFITLESDTWWNMESDKTAYGGDGSSWSFNTNATERGPGTRMGTGLMSMQQIHTYDGNKLYCAQLKFNLSFLG